MSQDGGNERRFSKVTDEPRHWIEYGVFAFVIITAMATATAASTIPEGMADRTGPWGLTVG